LTTRLLWKDVLWVDHLRIPPSTNP